MISFASGGHRQQELREEIERLEGHAAAMEAATLSVTVENGLLDIDRQSNQDVPLGGESARLRAPRCDFSRMKSGTNVWNDLRIMV